MGETPIQIRSIRPRHSEVSLTEEFAHRKPDQVCRTCRHNGNRTWAHRKPDVKAHVAGGGSSEDLFCQPTNSWGHYKILNQTSWKGRIVPIGTDTDVPTRAVVESCGQMLRPECAKCDNLNAIRVPVYYCKSGDTGPDGVYRPHKIHFKAIRVGAQIRWEPYTISGAPVSVWWVTIGGSCMLTSGCKPTPRKKRIESPSCGNCQYQYYSGDDWFTGDREINRAAKLTPYEQEHPDTVGMMTARERSQVRQDMVDDPRKARNLALWRKQMYPVGYRRWAEITILKTATVRGMVKIWGRFTNPPYKEVVFFNDHPHLVPQGPLPPSFREDDKNPFDGRTPEDAFVIPIEVGYPMTNKVGLHPPRRKRVRLWPSFPAAEMVIPDRQDLTELINEDCSDCKKNIRSAKRRAERSGEEFKMSMVMPCYYHAKGHVTDEETGETSWLRPEGLKPQRVYPPHAMMRLEERMGYLTAVDHNGNEPEPYGSTVANASVFRKWLPTLLEQAQRIGGADAVALIRTQYHQLTARLQLSKPVKTRPNWLQPSSLEPGKHWCSHPDGLDLRKTWGDAFGLERVDFDFDFGAKNTMDVNEELRVGRRQHQFTPQRLQEEVMANITSHPNYDPILGDIISPDVEMPTEWKVTKLEGLGGLKDMDGEPVGDPHEFVELLDEHVIVGDAGEGVEMPRFMTRRQQLFGYEMSKGFYGSRSGGDKTPMPVGDPTYVIFGEDQQPDPDQLELDDRWRCPKCDESYEQSEVDFWYPVCPADGSDLYVEHRARETWNPRATGGIGNAFAMDSEQTKARQRQFATLCPHWRLKADARITLDDVHGPFSDESRAADLDLEETIATPTGFPVHKVGSPDLTTDQQEHNRRMGVVLDEILTERGKYKDSNPDAPMDELLRKFPVPQGPSYFIYEPKAIGSAAKMG